MARRGENIYKRGDGRWEGRYIRGRTPEGRAQYGYVYAATYSACREKRRQRLRELPREITPSNNMTLPEAVDLFFAERERKLKESTVSRYRYVVRQYIQPQLGAAPLYTLTEQRVADFYRKLQEQGLSAKSTRDVGVLLRAILRKASKHGCFCTGLNAELPVYKKRQVEIFTEPEIVQLAHHIMDEPNLLLLDEPVSGIDQNGMELFYKTMDYLKTHYDLAIILISHDLDYVAKYADHVVLLDKTVAKQGTVKEVFESKEFERIFYTGEESWVREEEHK